MPWPDHFRIGIDLGGTKIAGVVLDQRGKTVFEKRISTPSGDYPATIVAIVQIVNELVVQTGNVDLSVGLGSPGAEHPVTGQITNANSTCLNGKPLRMDLQTVLNRPVRLANDADCLAMSEAMDGAAKHADSVFGVIIGTGVGGGLVVKQQLLSGINAIAGEWGHNPLPWPDPEQELPGPLCWCGKHGCLETWLSGPGLSADFIERGGDRHDAKTIVREAALGSSIAQDAITAYEQRLARGLAGIINILDPSVIVLGGGLSRIERLYHNVPCYWKDYVFSERIDTVLAPAQHGDASGARGAAWLW